MGWVVLEWLFEVVRRSLGRRELLVGGELMLKEEVVVWKMLRSRVAFVGCFGCRIGESDSKKNCSLHLVLD